jgi:hypothetical protein
MIRCYVILRKAGDGSLNNPFPFASLVISPYLLACVQSHPSCENVCARLKQQANE